MTSFLQLLPTLLSTRQPTGQYINTLNSPYIHIFYVVRDTVDMYYILAQSVVTVVTQRRNLARHSATHTHTHKTPIGSSSGADVHASATT